MTDSNKTRDTMAVCWKNVGEKRLYGIGTCLKWIVLHEFFFDDTNFIYCARCSQTERIKFHPRNKKSTQKNWQHQQSNICRLLLLLLFSYMNFNWFARIKVCLLVLVSGFFCVSVVVVVYFICFVQSEA